MEALAQATTMLLNVGDGEAGLWCPPGGTYILSGVAVGPQMARQTYRNYRSTRRGG